MRTAGSLYPVSPTACTRKPTVKRRRLNTTGSTPHVEPAGTMGKALTAPPDTSDASNASHLALSISSKLSCSSCHRTLSSSVRYGVGCAVVCTRCLAPTCAVCSRTCSSMQSSSPLTPAQTRPPSPLLIHGDTHIHPDCTLPKRTALGSLNAFVTNCNVPTPPSVKRKRSLVDKVDADTRVETYGQRSNNLPCDIIDDISPMPLLGCGRIICRACCVENVESDGTLCIDCCTVP